MINKDNSLILKGIAILLMLLHHLFYDESSRVLYNDIVFNTTNRSFGIANQLGIYGKLCVSIFVFLSGYGLAISNKNGITNLKSFYIHRFIRLYSNYWFIILLFVPLGIFFEGRTLSDAYGNHVLLNAILDFFGIISAFGHNGYNPTWWFYSCIIILYLLFPFLNRIVSRFPMILLGICIVIPCCIRVPVLSPIALYLFVFIIGIIIAKIPVSYFSNIKKADIIAAFVLLSLYRNFVCDLRFIIDSILCILLAIYFYLQPLNNWIKNVFIWLGKHSTNIFLFHTFIFYFWFEEYIYYTRNPLLIFISLLAICCLISVGIEYLKKLIRYDVLIKKLDTLLV